MGLYLVLPDLNQLGLKIDKNLEFSISAKNKEKPRFYSWNSQRAVFDRQNESIWCDLFWWSWSIQHREGVAWISRDNPLFIGVFLSVIFLLATVLVIYYKQISEGYEDRENFCDLATSRIGPKANGHHHSQTDSHRLFSFHYSFSFLYLGVAYKMIAKIVAIS